MTDEGVDDKEAESAQEGGGVESACLVVHLPPPPYSDVADHFRDLEAMAEACNLQGVSYHLRKAKLDWFTSFGANKSKLRLRII